MDFFWLQCFFSNNTKISYKIFSKTKQVKYKIIQRVWRRLKTNLNIQITFQITRKIWMRIEAVIIKQFTCHIFHRAWTMIEDYLRIYFILQNLTPIIIHIFNISKREKNILKQIVHISNNSNSVNEIATQQTKQFTF